MLLPLLLACTEPLPRELARPNAVAVGPDGRVYVSDFMHDRIVAFDLDGEHVDTFGGPGIGRDQLWRVYALAVDPAGDLLVVNRRPGDDAAAAGDTWEIKRFRDGKAVQVIPFRGHFSSDSHTMHALVARPDGSMVVANPGGGELFELDADGRFVGRLGGVPRPDAAPHALALESDTLWVVEQRSHRITRHGPDGAQLFVVDDAGQGPLRFPSSLAVCAGQWVAVADLGNFRVQRYDLGGRWLGGFEPERSGPDRPVQLLSVAVSPDCQTLALADSKGDRVLITDVDGEVVRELRAW